MPRAEGEHRPVSPSIQHLPARPPGTAHPNSFRASAKIHQDRNAASECRGPEVCSSGPLVRQNPSYDLGIGCFGSVEHSPLPLQSFLPLVVPQPPLPLQEFWPLQACFSFLTLVAFLPESLLLVLSFSPPACAIA